MSVKENYIAILSDKTEFDPVWWTAFINVVHYGEEATLDFNPYTKGSIVDPENVLNMLAYASGGAAGASYKRIIEIRKEGAR